MNRKMTVAALACTALSTPALAQDGAPAADGTGGGGGGAATVRPLPLRVSASRCHLPMPAAQGGCFFPG